MLFRIDHNSTAYFVEAPAISAAVVAWQRADKAVWGNEPTGDDEPEAIRIIAHGPVIRTGQVSVVGAVREADPLAGAQFEALASAMKKLLPPELLADVVAHLDPLTPFVEFLRRTDLEQL